MSRRQIILQHTYHNTYKKLEKSKLGQVVNTFKRSAVKAANLSSNPD